MKNLLKRIRFRINGDVYQKLNDFRDELSDKIDLGNQLVLDANEQKLNNLRSDFQVENQHILNVSQQKLSDLRGEVLSKIDLGNQYILNVGEHVKLLETPPPPPLTFSCPALNTFQLAFSTRYADRIQCASFCCENLEEIPTVPLCDSGKESIHNIMVKRQQMLLNPFSWGKLCVTCTGYELNRHKTSEQITYVNLSMLPAPCQCRCIYCENQNTASVNLSPSDEKNYDRVFGALEYANTRGLIANDARWQISSGEITIHPYKDRLLRLVHNKATLFFTNCFIYDEQIASNLLHNARSCINLSIDSGTGKTWYNVKGVDNFSKIVENVDRYHANSVRNGQITLKYIMLPNVNNRLDDYVGVIELMKSWGVSELTISRDITEKYVMNSDYQNDLINSVRDFVSVLRENSFRFVLHSFSFEEKQKINA